MENVCPECGAKLPEGQTCEAVFGEFLTHDYTDPGYGAVHFLTVSTFMVQHGRYSDEGLVWIRQKLGEFLEGGVTDQEIRRQASRSVDQRVRDWKVTRRPGDPPAPKVAWSVTIADVWAEAVDAESYQRAVKRWAEATVREMGG